MPGLADASGQNFTFAVHHDFDGSDVIITDVDSTDGFSFGSQHRLHAFFNVKENSRWLINARSLPQSGQIAGEKWCSGSGEVPLALVPCVPPAFLEPELVHCIDSPILKPYCLVHD